MWPSIHSQADQSASALNQPATICLRSNSCDGVSDCVAWVGDGDCDVLHSDVGHHMVPIDCRQMRNAGEIKCLMQRIGNRLYNLKMLSTNMVPNLIRCLTVLGSPMQ